jgi:hypothetical protein
MAHKTHCGLWAIFLDARRCAMFSDFSVFFALLPQLSLYCAIPPRQYLLR